MCIRDRIYLILAVRSAPRPISFGRNVYLRWGPLAAVVLLSVYAAQNAVAFVEGIEFNPVIGTAMFAMGPLREARASLDGRACLLYTSRCV